MLFTAAIAGVDSVNAVASERRLADRVSAEYQPNSESSTTSATDRHEPAAAEPDRQQQAAVVATSSADTDATCDTVSATMWFDCPEGATSFVTADDVDDDTDVNSSNSNDDDDDGKTERRLINPYIQTWFYLTQGSLARG